MNTEKYFNTDKDLTPKKSDVTPITEYGSRGEALYTVKTAYTDITVDGKKDPAYDYGLHISSKFSTNPDYYENRPTGFEASIIRGQNGMVYVFIEVTDDTPVDTGDLWAKRYWRADCVQFFWDMYNTRNDKSNFVFSAGGSSRNLSRTGFGMP